MRDRQFTFITSSFDSQACLPGAALCLEELDGTKRVNVSLEIIWLEASVCLSRAAHSACVTSAELD